MKAKIEIRYGNGKLDMRTTMKLPSMPSIGTEIRVPGYGHSFPTTVEEIKVGRKGQITVVLNNCMTGENNPEM